MATTGSGGGVDRISALPDELLHSILLRVPHTTGDLHYTILRLPQAADAARTSVLSRRWRPVWAHLPEIYLFYDEASAETQGRVDAALDACAAPAVDFLRIVMEDRKLPDLSTHPWNYARPPPRVPGHRISKWLLFASRRPTSTVHIEVPDWASHNTGDKIEHEVLLPLSDKIEAIRLSLSNHMLRLQILPLSGECTALVFLTLQHIRIDSRELEDVVSNRCPCLKVLNLIGVTLYGSPGFSMRSDSLEDLCLNVSLEPAQGRIQVTAPKLQTLRTKFYNVDACISAPMLKMVHWYSHMYNPSRHQIMDVKRHLYRLETTTACVGEAMALMHQFRTVHELILEISMPADITGYERFLSGITKLSRCEILVVKKHGYDTHSFKTALLCLLRNCAGVRKVVLKVDNTVDKYACKTCECPCRLPENSKIDDIVLSSLEEVEVDAYFGKDDDPIIDLLKLLCQLSETSREKLTITVSRGSRSANMREKIHRLCPPNNKIKVRVTV